MAQRLSDLYDCHFNELCAKLMDPKKRSAWRLKMAYEVGLAYLEAMDEVKHVTHGHPIFEIVAYEHEDNQNTVCMCRRGIRNKPRTLTCPGPVPLPPWSNTNPPRGIAGSRGSGTDLQARNS